MRVLPEITVGHFQKDHMLSAFIILHIPFHILG